MNPHHSFINGDHTLEQYISTFYAFFPGIIDLTLQLFYPHICRTIGFLPTPLYMAVNAPELSITRIMYHIYHFCLFKLAVVSTKRFVLL